VGALFEPVEGDDAPVGAATGGEIELGTAARGERRVRCGGVNPSACRCIHALLALSVVGALFGVGAVGFIDPAGRFRLIPDFVLLHPGYACCNRRTAQHKMPGAVPGRVSVGKGKRPIIFFRKVE
jgi:hypothetical protein